MKYQTKNYEHLTSIDGIGTEAMQMHFKLYEGYVNNVNIILEKLKLFTPNSPEWNELYRRLGWEWNGMRNHELFFDSLTNEPTMAMPEFFAKFKAEFFSICKIRGVGWALLVQDRKTKQLMTTWVNEHDAGMLSDVNIILNIDMFEHAYIKDFGTDRQKYVECIFQHIDWGVVEARMSAF